ncbi:MAG: hypothetical protein ABJB16_13725 [Saprospiraceae bacterium]
MKNVVRDTYIIVCLAFLIIPLSIAAQWQFEGSPKTCKSLDIATEGDTIVVLTSGGIFYSTDDANSWKNIPGPSNIYHEEIIQIEKGALYLTSGYGEIIQDTLRYLTDILRSDDWGLSWHIISGILEVGNPFKQILIKSDTVYLFDQSRILISFDRGDHYSILAQGLGQYSNYYLHNHKLYGRIEFDDYNIIMKSANDGDTWDTLYVSNYGVYINDISSIDEVLWKIEHRPSYHSCYISKSIDDGATWMTTDTISNLLIGFFDNQPLEIFGGDSLLYVLFSDNSGRLYYSRDNGITFNKETHFPSGKYPHYANGRLILTGTSLFDSQDNGETLRRISNNLEGATVSGIAKSGEMVWATANYSVYLKTPQSSEWQEQEGFQEVSSSDDEYLLAIKDGSAYRSADQGQNWILITPQNLGQTLSVDIFKVICAGNKMFISDAFHDLYYSADHGMKWHLSDQMDVYNLSYNGKYVSENFNGFSSSDDGIHWSVLPQTEDPYFHFNCDGVYYLSPYYYVSADTVLLRLHEDSSTWEKIRIPVAHTFYPSSPIIPAFSMTSYGDFLLLSYFGHGVFGSVDFGNTWYEINEGLTNYKTVELSAIGSDLYLGVDGGVWKRPLNDLNVAIHSPVNEIESCFTVTPNPVWDDLNIKFDRDDFKNGWLSLFSYDGKKQLTRYIESSADLKITANEIPAGLYCITYISSKTISSQPFIKL